MDAGPFLSMFPALWPEMSAALPEVIQMSRMARSSSSVSSAAGPRSHWVCVTDSTRRAAPDLVRMALTLHHICPGGLNLASGRVRHCVSPPEPPWRAQSPHESVLAVIGGRPGATT
jgi:hypothetical protein